MWNRAKRSAKQWVIVELWRLWGKLLPNGVAHHSLNRSSNFPSSLYSLLASPLSSSHTFLFIFLFLLLLIFALHIETLHIFTLDDTISKKSTGAHESWHDTWIWCMCSTKNKQGFIHICNSDNISNINGSIWILYNSGMDCTVNMCQTMFGF